MRDLFELIPFLTMMIVWQYGKADKQINRQIKMNFAKLQDD